MWKERFGTLRRDPETGEVKVIFVDGYAEDFAFGYYKLNSKWFAVIREYGIAIAAAYTRKEARHLAHLNVDKLIEWERTNGESMRQLFLEKARAAATIE